MRNKYICVSHNGPRKEGRGPTGRSVGRSVEMKEHLDDFPFPGRMAMPFVLSMRLRNTKASGTIQFVPRGSPGKSFGNPPPLCLRKEERRNRKTLDLSKKGIEKKRIRRQIGK